MRAIRVHTITFDVNDTPDDRIVDWKLKLPETFEKKMRNVSAMCLSARRFGELFKCNTKNPTFGGLSMLMLPERDSMSHRSRLNNSSHVLYLHKVIHA